MNEFTWRIRLSVKDLVSVMMYYNSNFTEHLVPESLWHEAEEGVSRDGNSDELQKLLNTVIFKDPLTFVSPGLRAFF